MTEVEMLPCGHSTEEREYCLRDGCITTLMLEAEEKVNEIPEPDDDENKLDLSHLFTEKQLDTIADSDLTKVIKKKLLAGLDYDLD